MAEAETTDASAGPAADAFHASPPRWADGSTARMLEDAGLELPPPPRSRRMGEEDWQSHFEDQLLDLYDELKRLHRVGGWPIFDRLTYDQFAAFAWRASSGYPAAR